MSPESPWSRMLKSSALYSIALFGQRIGGLLMLGIYTRHLRPADYGTLDILENVTSIVSIVLGANFSATLVYFYSNKQREDGERIAAGTALTGAALFGLLASGLGWAMSPMLEQWLFGRITGEPYFQLMFSGLAVGFVIEALFAWLRAADLTLLFVAGSLGRLVLGIIGGSLMLGYFRWGVPGVLWSNLTVAGITALGLVLLFWRKVGFSFDRNLFAKMLRVALPVSLSGIALFLIHFADRFFLKSYSTLEAIGLYSLAYKIAMMLSFAHSSFHTYWVSQVVRIMERDDGKRIAARTFTYMVAMLGFCALGLIILSGPVLAVVASAAYQKALVFIPLLVVAYFVRALGDYFRSFLIVAGRPGLDSWLNWAGAVACVLGYITLIPVWGPWGAAWATLAGFGVVLILTYVWIHNHMKLELEGRRLGILAAGGAVALSMHALLPSGGFLTAAGSVLAYPATILGLGFLSAGERQKVNDWKARIVTWNKR